MVAGEMSEVSALRAATLKGSGVFEMISVRSLSSWGPLVSMFYACALPVIRIMSMDWKSERPAEDR